VLAEVEKVDKSKLEDPNRSEADRAEQSRGTTGGDQRQAHGATRSERTRKELQSAGVVEQRFTGDGQ
jgi:hypothetical protein